MSLNKWTDKTLTLSGTARLAVGDDGPLSASNRTPSISIGPAASFGNSSALRVVASKTLDASPDHFSGIRQELTVIGSVNTSQSARGYYGYTSIASANTKNLAAAVAVQGVADVYGTGTISTIVGTWGEGDHSGSVTQPLVIGAAGYAGLYGSGNITAAHAVDAEVDNYGSGTVVTGAGVYIHAPTGAITNAYGLYVEAHTTGATLNYNIASKGATSKNLFEGQMYLTGLPTADPLVAGQLWNSAGTVKVSAG